LSDVPALERFSRGRALAAQAAPGGNGVIVVPFLSGERAPYWRPDLRGAIVGLDLATTPADVMRSAFESVAFALRSVSDVLRERLAAPQSLRLSGALARDPFVRQLIADVFGCESVLSNHDEASAFGAAMLAAIAIGLVADDRSVAALLHPVHQHRPSPGAFDRYGVLYERYAAAVAAAIQQCGTVP